jgi:cold shock CspA family protein
MGMFTGTVVECLGRGCYLIEQDETRNCVFAHQRNVYRRKFLHVNDRVTFTVSPSTHKPGAEEATDIQIIGLTIARQVSAPAPVQGAPK